MTEELYYIDDRSPFCLALRKRDEDPEDRTLIGPDVPGVVYFVRGDLDDRGQLFISAHDRGGVELMLKKLLSGDAPTLGMAQRRLHSAQLRRTEVAREAHKRALRAWAKASTLTVEAFLDARLSDVRREAPDEMGGQPDVLVGRAVDAVWVRVAINNNGDVGLQFFSPKVDRHTTWLGMLKANMPYLLELSAALDALIDELERERPPAP